MEFLAGGFTYDPVNDDYSVSALEDFFTEGYFNFTASNLAANISFEVDFLPGFTASAGIAKLPRQTLGAIQVRDEVESSAAAMSTAVCHY